MRTRLYLILGIFFVLLALLWMVLPTLHEELLGGLLQGSFFVFIWWLLGRANSERIERIDGG